MRISKLLSLGLLSSALGAAGGCGGDYGLFDVHGTFPNAAPGDRDREKVEQCKLSITDEKGIKVVDGFVLEPKKIPDATLPLGYFYVGCGNTTTPQDIGHLSYSTSRTSGSLTFTIDALDANSNPVYSGHSGAMGVKVFKTKDDVVKVNFVLEKK
jgi:hypothetical protein